MALTVAYLGPAGSFTEEALLSQPDLKNQIILEKYSFRDVIAAVEKKAADLGLVALENSIEGAVTETIDGLIFSSDLFIQREITLDIHQHLVGIKGAELDKVRKVISHPQASAQCFNWLSKHLPGASIIASNSTSEAAKIVRDAGDPKTVAIATPHAAKLENLEVLAKNIEDHKHNQTRFALLAKDKIHKPTGHDKTSIVCFQKSDTPGSLHNILGQFSARNLNLTKLESRPTKKALGEYCFWIDFVGHISDAIVADCLRDLFMVTASVKFLGSYPLSGPLSNEVRRFNEQRFKDAQSWITKLQEKIIQ